MRTSWAIFIALLIGAGSAWAAPPEYVDDPFEDNDFIDPPLILDVANTTNGRLEIGVMYTGSAIDKYSTHHGAMLDVNYHFLDTLGAGLSFSYYHGTLTNIVTSGRGIIGNKMGKCLTDDDLCDELDPNVPDFKQVTGVLTAQLVWSPLYGKINVVSELDVNLQIYLVAGGGINGRHKITAEPCPDQGVATTAMGFPRGASCPDTNPYDSTHFQLNEAGFGEGGLFDDPTGHGMAGAGLRIYLLDWFNIRADFRALFFMDSFDFDEDSSTADTNYASFFYTVQAGVGFVLF